MFEGWGFSVGLLLRAGLDVKLPLPKHRNPKPGKQKILKMTE